MPLKLIWITSYDESYEYSLTLVQKNKLRTEKQFVFNTLYIISQLSSAVDILKYNFSVQYAN